MRNKIFNLCLLMFVGIAFIACDSDDDDIDTRVALSINVTPVIADNFDVEHFNGMEVILRDTRTSSEYKGTLNDAGNAEIKVNKGIYDISIETKDKIEDLDVVYSAKLENVSVNDDSQKVELTLYTLPASADNNLFIFSEIFFNGETNSGRMMHPDQYFVVYNPNPIDLYLDGLSVAVTYHLSWQNKLSWYDTYMPNNIPVRGFVTIPGTGEEHILKAGERAVVAFTAIDHSKEEGYDNAVDLSGADFELYYGPDANDVDNPQVPDLIITENFLFHPRGYCAPIMFKLENGTTETITKFYTENYKVHERTVIGEDGTEEIVEDKFIVVPTTMVLDAVQTSDVPQDIVTRTIPETLDRGKFLVNGCHRQELAIRKTIEKNGKTSYQDTNNSTDDFILQKEQNSFPLNWRKN